MSEALGDILKGRTKGDEPPEFAVIKRFVHEKFQVKPALSLSNNNIIISVPGAALAGSLRMELHHLTDLCNTKRRLVIRIGQ